MFALNPGLWDYIYRNNGLFTALQSNYGAKVRAIGTLAVTPPLTPPAPLLPPCGAYLSRCPGPLTQRSLFSPRVRDVQNVIYCPASHNGGDCVFGPRWGMSAMRSGGGGGGGERGGAATTVLSRSGAARRGRSGAKVDHLGPGVANGGSSV